MRQRTSLRIEEALYRKFSVWVLERFGGRKLSDHIEKALEEYLENHKDA